MADGLLSVLESSLQLLCGLQAAGGEAAGTPVRSLAVRRRKIIKTDGGVEVKRVVGSTSVLQVELIGQDLRNVGKWSKMTWSLIWGVRLK